MVDEELPLMTWHLLGLGAELRPLRYPVTREVVDALSAALGRPVASSAGQVLPPALLTFPMLQAIDNTWRPRPGLVHTSQEYRWTAAVHVGSTLTVTGLVSELRLRRGRRYFTIETALDEGGSPVATGTSTFLYPEGDGS